MLKSSIQRPAWTSTPETGSLQAFCHRHRRPRDSEDVVERHFYGRTEGFENRSQAAELREGGGK